MSRFGSTGELLLTDHQSEHVVCAGGQAVLAAGELVIERHPALPVSNVTNQSTGYGPEPTCWPTVQRALRRLEMDGPADFTPAFVFRRCEDCIQINIVKDTDLVSPLAFTPGLTLGSVERQPRWLSAFKPQQESGEGHQA